MESRLRDTSTIWMTEGLYMCVLPLLTSVQVYSTVCAPYTPMFCWPLCAWRCETSSQPPPAGSRRRTARPPRYFASSHHQHSTYTHERTAQTVIPVSPTVVDSA